MGNDSLANSVYRKTRNIGRKKGLKEIQRERGRRKIGRKHRDSKRSKGSERKKGRTSVRRRRKEKAGSGIVGEKTKKKQIEKLKICQKAGKKMKKLKKRL